MQLSKEQKSEFIAKFGYYPSKLLTTNNFKTQKGEKYDITTYIVYMSPFTDNSKGINLCPFASAGCAKACLVKSGFGGMYQQVQDGRRNKTEWFLANRAGFMAALDAEIAAIEKKHLKVGKAFAIRLNGTSDIRYEKIKVRDGKNIFELYPNVQFYDYTKNPKRFAVALPANYHLTFSRSETNEGEAIKILKAGFNVAVVFTHLPETYLGYKVVNGDETDLRFKDAANVVVGLKYKVNTGKGGEIANLDALISGFVVANLSQKKALLAA